MPYTKTPWVANVTPVTAASMNNIEAGIASLSAPAPSATPPASPADGDIWYLPADAANGAIWQMRYNAGSASAYKWEYVGGGPMRAIVYPQEATTNTGFVGLTTPGPGFTLPRAGDYDVRWGAFAYNSTAGFGTQMAVYVNGVAAPGCSLYGGVSYYTHLMREFTLNAAAPSYGLTCLYAAMGGGTGQWGDRWVAVTPRRLS